MGYGHFVRLVLIAGVIRKILNSKLEKFYSSIAQSVEQRTVNPCVPGSSPGRGAKEVTEVGSSHSLENCSYQEW